ncbi:MAG: hypothetical protein B7Z41_03610 [Rhizobiales bacterium 12-66-7]|nr:MAG: hypothetical protein B7Z41_03610 [Rhizobiales bacterium 12-66-7]
MLWLSEMLPSLSQMPTLLAHAALMADSALMARPCTPDANRSSDATRSPATTRAQAVRKPFTSESAASSGGLFIGIGPIRMAHRPGAGIAVLKQPPSCAKPET